MSRGSKLGQEADTRTPVNKTRVRSGKGAERRTTAERHALRDEPENVRRVENDSDRSVLPRLVGIGGDALDPP